MPNESEALKRFVTAEFTRGALAQDQATFLLNQSIFDYGQWMESVAWLSIGAEVGYFDHKSAEEAVQMFRQHEPPELPNIWPRRFRRQSEFSAVLITPVERVSTPYGRAIFVADMLIQDQPASLATFQAALILSREFREKCFLSLQRALQSDDDFANNHFNSVEGTEVIAALGDDRAIGRENPAILIAGFFQLIDLLAAFDSVFSPQDLNEGSQRTVVARLISNLLAWRLNLRDSRTLERLAIVEQHFWTLCRREMKAIELRGWSSRASRHELQRLLDRWRDRSDPDIPLMGDLPTYSGPGSSSLVKSGQVEA